MGGLGSGNWHRPRAYETVDEFPEFFATDFKMPGGEVIARSRNELAMKEIAFRYLRSGQHIWLFQFGFPNMRFGVLDLVLRVNETPCNFGGAREWLICPVKGCGRRTRSLFIGKDGAIGCRKCQGLIYESQYGGRVEKRLTRIRAMHRKIGREAKRKLKLAKEVQQEFLYLIEELKKSTV